MFDKKQYYISSLSLKNRYLVREEFKNISAYESHRHNIYLNGFDRKQILTEADKILFRYNGFQNHNRNSIYKIPDFIANNYTSIPWIPDVFSLVAVIFECMYRWHLWKNSYMCT